MKLRKFDLTVMAASLALLVYLVWHWFYGPRNFAHRDGLLATAAEMQVELGTATGERDKLDRKVMLMRPETLDPDMLEELSRQYLNFANSNELVLIQK